MLKQVAAQFLPKNVITSRKKGFSSPMGNWFDARVDPWLRGWLEDGQLVQLGLLRQDWAQHLDKLLVERGAVGLRARWLLLTAELWARRWIAGENLFDKMLKNNENHC